jgi:ribose transport system substrate-binding protein
VSITGLGPHGERGAPADKLALTADEAARARAGHFTIAVVLHTTTSDWSRLEAAGISDTLSAYGARVIEIVDCSFEKSKQNLALSRLADSRVDAVISIPIGVSGVADAHRRVTKSGKKLILLDNVPTGLSPGVDYVAVVSADNFNLGEIAAELLSPHIPDEGVAGILTYEADFFAANEREIAFRKWMGVNRPDMTLVRGRFAAVEDAGAAFDKLLAGNSDLDGLFVTWDVPALRALDAIRATGRALPVTTVDLGNAIASELAVGGLVKGVAAQRPYDQGAAAAVAALMSLVGRQLPPWIATAGIAVARDNLSEVYQTVWRARPPGELFAAR